MHELAGFVERKVAFQHDRYALRNADIALMPTSWDG
jgi:hypothetical protein